MFLLLYVFLKIQPQIKGIIAVNAHVVTFPSKVRVKLLHKLQSGFKNAVYLHTNSGILYFPVLHQINVKC